MVIFIEGVDRSGKTSLAAKLTETIKVPIIHCSKPLTDDPFSEYQKMLNDIRDNCFYKVYDRGYLGEYVYANLWRGGCKISDEQFQVLDKIALSKKAVVIHAFADTKDIIERCRKDGEDLLKEDQIDKCKELFREIISKTLLPVYNYNSSLMSLDDFYNYIQKLIW